MRTTLSQGSIRRILASLATAGLSVSVLGCATGHTYVLQAHTVSAVPMTFAVKESDSTAQLDPSLRDYFRNALTERIQKGSMLMPAESGAVADLVVEYRFVAFDAGRAGARVANTAIQVVGVPVSGLGDGNLGVNVLYRNREGNTLAQIVADGPIAGLFGSSKGGLDTAAASIATYTQETFQPKEITTASSGRGADAPG